MRHGLTLDYDLGAGALAPHVAALREGRALGARCTGCGRVSFPPLRACPCGGALEGRELSGAARLEHVTRGPAGEFALARFEGAAGSAVVRLAAAAAGLGAGARVRLAAVPEGLPGLVVVPAADEGAAP